MKFGCLATIAVFFTVPRNAGARSLPPTASFSEFISVFGRGYQRTDVEYAQRLALFEERARAAREQNAKPGSTWVAVLNKFADRTEEELKSLRGWRPSHTMVSGQGVGLLQSSRDLYDSSAAFVARQPREIEWSHLKSLQKGVDQGGCGSCWAVATATLLDAHYEIATNETKEFSVQQLVNCVPNPHECGGTGGCGGSTVELALEYVRSIGIGQLATTDQYPYQAVDGSCESKDDLTALSANLRGVRQHYRFGATVQFAAFSTLPKNQLEPLMRAMLKGPVAVSVAASNWQSYASGIFNSCDEEWTIDHATLATGYGEDNGQLFFRIRNSWGEDWGELGYIRIERPSSGDAVECGEDMHPEVGVECKPYPKKVRVCGTCGVLYDTVAPSIFPVTQ